MWNTIIPLAILSLLFVTVACSDTSESCDLWVNQDGPFLGAMISPDDVEINDYRWRARIGRPVYDGGPDFCPYVGVYAFTCDRDKVSKGDTVEFTISTDSNAYLCIMMENSSSESNPKPILLKEYTRADWRGKAYFQWQVPFDNCDRLRFLSVEIDAYPMEINTYLSGLNWESVPCAAKYGTVASISPIYEVK